MITYFKNKNHKSKKLYEKLKTLSTISDSLDILFIFGATSTSITLSITGVGLKILPVSAASACILSSGNKVLHKIIINKYKKYKTQYEKDRQTIKLFDKIYRKTLQDNIFNKIENESLCDTITEHVDETKNESFF